jgi:photosystem II stability/assembly factor-like uncharacterized protein
MPAPHQLLDGTLTGMRRHHGLLARVAAAAMLVCGGLASTAVLAAGGSTAATAAPAAAKPDTGSVKQIRRGTAHDALYDVAFEGQRGVAVGAFGTVLATADGGSTWERQAFPMSNLALMSVTMRDGKCIAVGQIGLAYTSDDCKAWKAVPTGTKSRLLAVDMNRQGLAYAIGGFGTILRSTDWGKTWAAQTVDWTNITTDGAEPHLYDLHIAEDGTVTAVGEFELVLRSNGEGSAWKVLHKGERSLFGLTVTDGGKLYAVGQSGAFLMSTNDGAAWNSVATGTGAILTGIHASAKGEITASGINSVVASADGGATWTSNPSRLVRSAAYQALASSEGSGGKRRLLAVGAGGSIIELDQ